jgi:hypothetical protein
LINTLVRTSEEAVREAVYLFPLRQCGSIRWRIAEPALRSAAGVGLLALVALGIAVLEIVRTDALVGNGHQRSRWPVLEFGVTLASHGNEKNNGGRRSAQGQPRLSRGQGQKEDI